MLMFILIPIRVVILTLSLIHIPILILTPTLFQQRTGFRLRPVAGTHFTSSHHRNWVCPVLRHRSHQKNSHLLHLTYFKYFFLFDFPYLIVIFHQISSPSQFFLSHLKYHITSHLTSPLTSHHIIPVYDLKGSYHRGISSML